jgi:hypothetical protein
LSVEKRLDDIQETLDRIEKASIGALMEAVTARSILEACVLSQEGVKVVEKRVNEILDGYQGLVVGQE